MGFCGGCAKALLIIFNFIFWLSGAAILGVGIWMIVDKDIGSYFEVLNVDTHDQYFKYAAYMLIGFGVFVLLVGFCGCCGAIRGSKCLLGFYIFFLVLIFAGELASGILMIIYKIQIEDKVDSVLKTSIQDKYGKTTSVSDAWNVVQVQLECCGGAGPVDYTGSYYETTSTPNKVPKSCCVLANKADAFENAKDAMPSNATACMELLDGSFYHSTGCKQGLINWSKEHTGILIGVAVGIAALEIFGIIFAICLCREVDREDKY